MDFEEKLSRLEEIVAKMERGEMQLQESLKLFEEGVQLSRDCHQQLNAVEAQVKKLISFDAQGNPIVEAFKPED